MTSSPEQPAAVDAAVEQRVAAGATRIDATMLMIERALADAEHASVVVLVEGLSDQIAVEVLAARLGRSFPDEGIVVVPAGGVTNMARLLARFGPAGRGLRIVGLYDAPTQRRIRRNLAAAGIGAQEPELPLSALGFHACDRDLEDELIRALGPTAVEEVIAAHGDLVSLRRLQQMPAHRGQPPAAQLHRFIGTRSGRKYRYARFLTEALDLRHLPPPLAALLAQL